MLQETRTAISIQTTGVRGAIQLRRSDVSGFFESSRATNAWVRRVIDSSQCRFQRKSRSGRSRKRERRFDQTNATSRRFFGIESFLSSRNFRYLVIFRASSKLPADRGGDKQKKIHQSIPFICVAR